MVHKNTVDVVKPPTKELRLACGTCGTVTSHKALTCVKEQGEVEEAGIDYWEKHFTVQCQGCKVVTFATETRTSEDIDDQGTPIPTLQLYPTRLTGAKKLEWEGTIPYEIYRVYDQTHSAVSSKLSILAGVGLRTVVEAVCKDQGLDKFRLADNIDGLATQGVITTHDATILHSLRFMGNDAAHYAKAPTTEELSIAIQIVEHLLKGVYIVPDIAKKLPKAKPKASGKTSATAAVPQSPAVAAGRNPQAASAAVPEIPAVAAGQNPQASTSQNPNVTAQPKPSDTN